MPTLFVNHAAACAAEEVEALGNHLRDIASRMPLPQAVLVISAHWCAPKVTVTGQAEHKLLLEESSELDNASFPTSPAVGDPKLAARIVDLLLRGGIDGVTDTERGIDHGAFVPLQLMYPNSEVPVVQVSLHRSMDPALHLKLGAALSPLRKSGVLIIGSGSTFNSNHLRAETLETVNYKAKIFDDSLLDALKNENVKTRHHRLIEWKKAPHALFCHPREDHIIPLHVAAGAAGSDPCERIWRGTTHGVSISSYQFGI
eukprot:TRINITY_DN14617_c0_g1_i1.p1 TRINITY_DN14617_c0_g1~~TRINITY_DN14617_c0_g1_i1.p1  ORF type:complete len:278 (-),score=48.47 TRINITY_DN14617_c0_g1_i1:191-964(-)